MEAGTLVNSSADMLSGVDAGDFNVADTGADAGAEVEASADQPVETPPEPAPEEPEQEPEPEPEEPEAEAQAAPEELPEGVRKIKDRQGNEGLFVPQERWQEIYNGYQSLPQMAEMIGEPLTPEALQLRHQALMAGDQMQNDLLSGDPQLQTKVLQHFIDVFADARQHGEIGHDPMVPLAGAFYDKIKASAPDAYSSLRFKQAADLRDEIYSLSEEVNAKGDPKLALNLARSASHIARALGIEYRKSEDIERSFAQPPTTANYLQVENERLKAQLQGFQQQSTQSQYDYFHHQTKQAVLNAVMENSILPAIPQNVVDAWKRFPTNFQEQVIKPLQSKIVEVIGQDKQFANAVEQANRRLKSAVNNDARNAISREIVQMHVNRANVAARAVARPILAEAAKQLEANSKLRNQRQQAASAQRGPKGPQNPVQRSLVPQNFTSGDNGYATEASMMRDIARHFPNG